MSQNGNKNKIFISYSDSDIERADKLFEIFQGVGLEPWMKSRSLLAGRDKDIEIRKAIENSKYFIALFSSISVRERGYIQKELKFALDVLDGFPEGEVFILPIRLDACEIPYEKLREIENADLFPDWKVGVEKVLRSLGIEEDGVRKTLRALNWEEIQRLAGDSNLEIKFSDVYWKDLIKLIDEEKCIPFIGPAASSPWISLRTLADKWMGEHGYPFDDPDPVKTHIGEEDSYKLARVTQFLAINKGDEEFPKLLLQQEVSEIYEKYKMESPDFSLPADHPCSVLARLDLPLYLTTNYDHLMEIALKKRGKEPKSVYCRWNDKLEPISDEDRTYQPTESKPLVYHFHGVIDEVKSMVLTERDYFDFVIKLNKEGIEDLFPTVIRTKLPGSRLLFIGYSLQDINFRAIFQGALSSFNMRNTSVAVQIPPSFSSDPSISSDKKQRVVKYLNDYAKKMFEVRAYWGNSDDFVRQLRQKFENFRRTKDPLTVSTSL